MNTDNTYLHRRIEFIQDVLDNPSKFDIPHPEGNSRPAYSISKDEIDYLNLDNTISKHMLNQEVNHKKLLFGAHKFQSSETILTDFQYDGCFLDYCFVQYCDGLQIPYAIGLEVDEPFSGWWAGHPRITMPSSTYSLTRASLFFVTPKQIFVQYYGLHSDLPQAEKFENIVLFNLWIQEMKDNERHIFQMKIKHPFKRHLEDLK